jgi:hypothetical protein
LSSRHKLNVFDFDGTLVATHEADTGKLLYEQLTGGPWTIENTPTAIEHGHDPKFRRTGWWGRIETLTPPLIPRPVPTEFRIDSVYHDYLKAKADPEARNVLVTGRHSKIDFLVSEVLKELGIEFEECYFKGGYPLVKHPNYPKDNETPKFKVHAIVDHLITQEIKRVEVWEDREDIVELFNTAMKERIKEEHPQVETLVIHDVKSNRNYCHPISSCKLKLHLSIKPG